MLIGFQQPAAAIFELKIHMHTYIMNFKNLFNPIKLYELVNFQKKDYYTDGVI